jgi:MFS family permease
MAGDSASQSEVRNLIALAACQGLWMTGASMTTTVASLAAVTIAEANAVATLPQALQTTGMMLASIPAARLMGRIGRRKGFAVGALSGTFGAALATAGICLRSIVLFWVGSLFLGIYYGFATFYRFAATEAVPEDRQGKAISYVLAGGTLAAFLGPGLAAASRDLLLPMLFAGCYAVIGCLAAAAVITSNRIQLPIPARNPGKVEPRAVPIAVLIKRPGYALSLLNAVGAYAPMTFLMVATPLGMQMCGLSFKDTAFVIQWHILAMFAPSFFVGHVIDRVGARAVMFVGSGVMLLSPLVASSGAGEWSFFVALLLLGFAWNLLFTGATRLLTSVAQGADRSRVQGLNDFVVFGTTALCSYLSGVLLWEVGWQMLNLLVVPFSGALLLLNGLHLIYVARRPLHASEVPAAEKPVSSGACGPP